MPENDLYKAISTLQLPFNRHNDDHCGWSSIRERQAVDFDAIRLTEKKMHKRDWLLLYVTYDEKKAENIRNQNGAFSVTEGLRDEAEKGGFLNELPYATMPGGPFQSFLRERGGEIFAIRSAFLTDEPQRFSRVHRLEFVKSVKLIAEGEPVYAMVMQKQGHKITVDIKNNPPSPGAGPRQG